MDTLYDLRSLLLILVQHRLLIRDSVILTFNWQRLGWAVAVEQSRSESQVLILCGRVLIAVLRLIKCQRVEAKLIEISTGRCCNHHLLPLVAQLDLGSIL